MEPHGPGGVRKHYFHVATRFPVGFGPAGGQSLRPHLLLVESYSLLVTLFVLASLAVAAS